MDIDFRLVAMAVGIALVIEGMPYFLLAEKMPAVLRGLSELSPRVLRIMGLAAMAAGLVLVWLMRG